MSIDYISIEEAIARPGLRMVVVGRIPSPWSEAAKGIPWAAVRLAYDSPALKSWAGQRSAPVAVYGDEPPRDRWIDILMLAERLAPTPSLLPADPGDRALVLGISHEICGEQGLAWSRRLQLVDAGLRGAGGFAPQAAAYIGKKYGWRPEAAPAATTRVVQLLGWLAARLKAQQAAGSGYLVGSELTAADIYLATALALLRPLPQDVCDMDPATRAAFEFHEPATDAALEPVLLEHRERLYRQHLGLPLEL